MKQLWQASTYWPVWLTLGTATFLLREIWALATGRGQDTLSEWVWRALKVTAGETPAAWSATDYLVFGVWCVLLSWLTWHFFFHKFT